MPTFKKTTVSDLKRRFCTAEALTGPSMLASVLDPRYKNLFFANQESRAALFEAIREEIKQITPVIVDERPVAKKSKPAPRMDFLLASSWRNTASKNADTTKDPFNEFVACLQTAQADNETDPVQWWKENASCFPAILKVAQKYLAIPATSVPSERVFSTAGNIVNHKRSCLVPDNVNMLTFLNKNAKL